MLKSHQKQPISLILIGAMAMLLTACQPKTPTPEPRPVITTTMGEEEILVLTGQKTVCEFAKPMQCLVVQKADGSQFGLAYNAIDDFTPIAGKAYTLKVRPKIANEQANGTSEIVGYQLVEILKQ